MMRLNQSIQEDCKLNHAVTPRLAQIGLPQCFLLFKKTPQDCAKIEEKTVHAFLHNIHFASVKILMFQENESIVLLPTLIL